MSAAGPTKLSEEERRERRRAKHAAYQRAYRQRHTEKARESVRKWRSKNRDKVRATERRFRLKHPEKAKAKRQAWKSKNRELLRERDKLRHKQGRDCRKAYHRERDRQRKEQLARFGVVLPRKGRKPEDKVYAAARAAIPATLPRYMREHVMADVVLAYYEGKLIMAEMAGKVAGFVRAYWREFDQFKTVSLDAKVPGTDITYLDRLADEAA